MSCTSQEKNNYISVVATTGEINPNNMKIVSYVICQGNEKVLKQFVDLFLKEIDNEKLVTIDVVEDNCGETVFGRPRMIDFFVDISIHNEDIDKKDSNSHFRIKVKTNVFPNNRDYFVKFFENFYKALS